MPSTGDPERPEETSPPAGGATPSPYVSPSETLAEATLKATIVGILFGILFGAANAYLGLRAGLTISTSIPVAVMTVAFFRALRASGVESSILEANLSQTVGSASSSVASGVIFTLPALFLWGFDTTLLQITVLAMSGGLLGVLFMIPLRSYLIVREHRNLPYPEGTACAQVLKASQVGGGRARNVFVGLGVGAVLKGLTGWLRAVPDQLQVSIPFLRKGQLACAVSPALLGVGYILGPRIAMIMVGGGLLSSLVIIPAIAWWGEGRMAPLYPETALTITEMSPSLIWTRYVRYIGAGAVATGGLVTLIRSVPTMIESFRIGSRQIRERLGSNMRGATVLRTDQDLSLLTVGGWRVPRLWGAGAHASGVQQYRGPGGARLRGAARGGVRFFLRDGQLPDLERRAATSTERAARRDTGILFGSGLVGGEGLIGVVIAGAAGYAVSRGQAPWSLGYEWAGAAAEWLALALLVALAVFFWRLASSSASAPGPTLSSEP